MYFVNQWLLVPIQTPTGFPNFGCGKEETLFSANSSKVITHGYENSAVVEQRLPVKLPGSQEAQGQAPFS